MLVRRLSLIFIQISLVEGIVHQCTEEIMSRNKAIQYNTIKILLSTPHGGFSETYINSTGNKKKHSRIVNKQLLRKYLHIEFMTSQIDYQ